MDVHKYGTWFNIRLFIGLNSIDTSKSYMLKDHLEFVNDAKLRHKLAAEGWRIYTIDKMVNGRFAYDEQFYEIFKLIDNDKKEAI
jgi:hypothetical protein